MLVTPGSERVNAKKVRQSSPTLLKLTFVPVQYILVLHGVTSRTTNRI